MGKQFGISESADAYIRKADLEDLHDVSGLCLDLQIPRDLRAGYLLEKMGSIDCFRVGELGVKLAFPDQGPPLQEVLLAFLRRKRGKV